MRWAKLNIMKSILAQQDICEGIDRLHQHIDTCLAICHVDFSPLNYVAKLLTFMEPLPGEGWSGNCAESESTSPCYGA
jgi:hypothetical protein